MLRPQVSIKVGNKTIDTRKDKELKLEAGTRIFQEVISGDVITAGMENISVNKEDEGVSWGAVYWQYFEDLGKKIEQENQDRSPKNRFCRKWTPKTARFFMNLRAMTKWKLAVFTVQGTVRTDPPHGIHAFERHASCDFRTASATIGIQTQEGLYYYQSPTDVAMNFFFDYLPKGTFVFEYDLNATQIQGLQQTGIPRFGACTLQSSPRTARDEVGGALIVWRSQRPPSKKLMNVALHLPCWSVLRSSFLARLIFFSCWKRFSCRPLLVLYCCFLMSLATHTWVRGPHLSGLSLAVGFDTHPYLISEEQLPFSPDPWGVTHANVYHHNTDYKAVTEALKNEGTSVNPNLKLSEVGRTLRPT